MHETEMREKKKVSGHETNQLGFQNVGNGVKRALRPSFVSTRLLSSLSLLWCGRGDGVVGRPPTGSSAWRPAASMGAPRRVGRPWAWRPAAGAAPTWSRGRPRALLRRGCRGRPWAWRPAAVAVASAAPPWAWKSAAGVAPPWSRRQAAAATPLRLRTPPGRDSVLRRESVVHHDAIVLVYTERLVTGGKKKAKIIYEIVR